MEESKTETYTKGYKYRIYPNKEQQKQIINTIGCCRFVYNHFLEVRSNAWKNEKKSVGMFESSRLLTELKCDSQYVWLNAPGRSALTYALRNLDSAFQAFFKKRGGYPKFKSRYGSSQSYCTQQTKSNAIHIEGNYIKLPKLTPIKIKLHRNFTGIIKNATVSKTPSGKFFVSLCVEEDIENLLQNNAGGEIALKMGIKKFYTDNNGNCIESPRALKKYEKKLARESRRFSRKKKGSKNREKQRIILARVHEKIANIRKDFLQNESIKLVRNNQLIAIEDLKVSKMMKDHVYAKNISDASWAEFFRMLEYKAKLYGTDIVKIPNEYPRVQICHICGYQYAKIKDNNITEWYCPQCGAHHNRNINAAINIMAKAKDIMA